jgi:hypothetical protein
MEVCSSRFGYYYRQVLGDTWDSVIGIANRYGLVGLEMESPWGRDFPHPSRPVLGPTQPPIQGVPGHSQR